MSENSLTPKIGAIAVLLHEGRFLLVQRGKDPGRGQWGFPGGHVELGETAKAAAIRELEEETSVIATAGDYLTAVDVIGKSEAGDLLYHYLLAVVPCTYVSGTATAGDDAAAAEWIDIADILSGDRPLSEGVARVAKQVWEARNDAA